MHLGWLIGLLAAAAPAKEGAALRLVFCCRPENDLYRVVTAGGRAFSRFDTPAEAVAQAPEGAGVLLLADGYPQKTTPLDAALFEQARARRLRLYVEYPSALPGLEVGPPRATGWERAVVSSDFFGPALEKLRILALHDCHYVPVAAAEPHLVVARVAGFDTAVYGLPKSASPLLFQHSDGLLVATTKLSQFVTGRYAPEEAWQAIWQAILQWLAPGAQVPELRWTPSVRPSYGAKEPLPAGVERQAARRGAEWFRQSRLLVAPSREEEIARLVQHSESGPTPPADAPVGDGSRGILEGYGAEIRYDGSQVQRLIRRSDCNGESAMGLAFAGRLGEPALAEDGRRILDYWYFESVAQQGKRADPANPAFGLVAWGTTNWAWEKAFYGDDNARLLLGTMAAAALLKSDRWDEPMLKCLLGNLRTTGRRGFRQDRIDLPDLEAAGWQRYFDAAPVSYSPHYQAYLWACYLWAYRATGYPLFLQRAESAIRMTMAAYPDRWRWTNGIAQERARMLLPLAWLVRLKDTPEHRAWLRRVAEDLLRLQDASGAIREELGPAGSGAYGPPRSNEEYGTSEATLMQQNGDPVCDLLYTSNFAFIGLHEAAAATGDRFYADAEGKLARFLCRIQARSETHPELDGAWFRAFDFRSWEYWASSADAGWGAWSIETGWTQGWIVAVLSLRQMRTSFWDLTAGSQIGRHLDKLRPLFLPDGIPTGPPQPITHLAAGKPVKLAVPADPRYPGSGPATLTDGVLGENECHDPAWIGFEGADLDATIDLGRLTEIRAAKPRFLQHVALGIFLPSRVEIELSADGETFRTVATLTPDVPASEPGPLSREMAAEFRPVQARYVRVHAHNIGVCPPGHPAAGVKAWLFADEVVVE